MLQIVLRMGRFACNFLCSKSCSGWAVSRATFCAPNRAPERVVSRATFCAPNRAPERVVSRATFCAPNRAPERAVSRATFCAPNRAPDGSFCVQLFVLQIVLCRVVSVTAFFTAFKRFCPVKTWSFWFCIRLVFVSWACPTALEDRALSGLHP